MSDVSGLARKLADAVERLLGDTQSAPAARDAEAKAKDVQKAVVADSEPDKTPSKKKVS